MIDLVHAINQQVPMSVSHNDMLVLTKFAELPLNPYNPIAMVSGERFMAMTHIKDHRTLNGYLKSLEEKNLLVPVGTQGSAATSRYYKLCLPKGFNKQEVDSNIMIVYGGMPFSSKYAEKFVSKEADKNEKELPPVTMEEAKSAMQSANLAPENANLAAEDAKIPAINKGTNEETKNVYVTDDDLVKVWVRISKVTGEVPVTRIERKYKNIVKSESDARAAERALNYVEDVLSNRPETIRDIRKYTCAAIKREIAADKAKVSPLEPNHDAPQSAAKTALNQYELAAEKSKSEIKKQAEDAQIVVNIQAEEDRKKQEYFAKKMPEVAEWPSVLELPENERTAYLKAFKTMFSAKWNYDDLITAFETDLKSAGNVKIIDFTRDFASERNNLVFGFPVSA